MCAKLGAPALQLAKSVYSRFSVLKGTMDLILLNSFINMFDKCGQPFQALEVFQKFSMKTKIDDITYVSVLTACGNIMDSALQKGEEVIPFMCGNYILKKVLQIFLRATKESHVSTTVLAAYLRLLAKCGHIEKMKTTWKRFGPSLNLNDNLAVQSLLNTSADLGEAGLYLGRQV